MAPFVRPFTVWAVTATLMSSFMGQALAATATDPWTPPLLASTNLNKIYHVDQEMRFSITWKNQSSQSIKATFPNSCFFDLSLMTPEGDAMVKREEVCLQVIEERSISSNGDVSFEQSWKLGDYAITPGQYSLVIESDATLMNSVTGQTASVAPLKVPMRLYDDTVVYELKTSRSEYDRNDIIRATFKTHNYKQSGSATFPNSSCKEANWEISKVNGGEVVYKQSCGNPITTTITPEQTYVETWSYDPDDNGDLAVGKYRLRYSTVAETTFDIVARGTSANDDDNDDENDEQPSADPPPPGNWPFTDVPPTHWASGYIQQLKESGLLRGDFLRRFHPNLGMRRVQFLKLVLDGLDIEVPRRSDLESSGFTDVDANDWYYAYVEFAHQNGIVKNTPAGRAFGVYQFIPRHEALLILMNALEYEKGDFPRATQMPFADVQGTDSFHDAVSKAYAAGLINGYGNTRFGPHNNLTKAEAAKIVFRAREL